MKNSGFAGGFRFRKTAVSGSLPGADAQEFLNHGHYCPVKITGVN